MHKQGAGTILLYHTHLQFEKPFPCQHIEWLAPTLCNGGLTSCEFCKIENKTWMKGKVLKLV